MSFADELSDISDNNSNSIPNGIARILIESFRESCRIAASNGYRSCEAIAMMGIRDIICEPDNDKEYTYRNAWRFNAGSYIEDQDPPIYPVFPMNVSDFDNLKKVLFDILSKDGYKTLEIVNDPFDILITTPRRSYGGLFDFTGHNEGGRIGYYKPKKVSRNRIIIRAEW